MGIDTDKARAIFQRAVEQHSPDEWPAFLDEACGGDVFLRRRMDVLLQAHQGEDKYLDRGEDSVPAPTGRVAQPNALYVGTQIGPYKLLEEIAEGGMGVVYMAEQAKPIRRKVALKIIKPGMDSRQVVSRFEAERQALSLVEHPNVAKVFDAGTTGDGRPYFVMELVKGQAITQYCDAQRLTPRERLELLLPVCQAIQHAHQKGIIHRDIKPSNILVARYDQQVVPKVIDFGVAKATRQPLTERTLFTGYGQIIGTLEYMSPEQATFNQLDIDTRSDIYSLGVVMYELLTGTTPIDRQRIRTAAWDETLRVIREEEPPKPSTRLLESKSTLPLIAFQRQTEPGKLARLVRGDLDWIVMKALEKDRNWRYETPGALAADMQRYLRGEPVQAGPPSQVYRLGKFARRYKLAFAAVTAIVLSLLIGTAVATWQAIDAKRARELADDRLAHAWDLLQREQLARQEAAVQRDRAERNADQAHRLLYAGDMRLACYAWQRNDGHRMRALLDRHVPRDGEEDLRGFEWHLLSSQREVTAQEVLRSDRPLYFVRFSPDGKLLAASGADAQIRLFDATSFDPVMEISSQQVEVNGLDFSPDSSRLASAGDDGTVIVWDVQTGREQSRIKAHPDGAYQVLFAPGGELLITCGRDPVVRLWHPVSGASLGEFTGHTANVEAISLSPGGVCLAAVAKNAAGLEWNLQERTRISELVLHPESPFNCVSYSSSGLLVATGQKNGMLTLFRSDDGTRVAMQRLPDAIQCLAFTPAATLHSCWLAIGCRDGSLRVLPVDYDTNATGLAADARQIDRGRHWQAHAARVYSAAFSPKGKKLLTAGEDGRLIAWDWEHLESSRMLPGPVTGYAICSADEIITCGETVSVWSLSTGKRLRDLPESQARWHDVAYAPAIETVFAIDQTGTVLAWRLAENRPPDRVWPSPAEPAHAESSAFDLSVSPNGSSLVRDISTTDGSRFVELRQAESVSRQSCNMLNFLIHSPDGQCVAFDYVKDIRFVDARSGQYVSTLSGHQTTIKCAAFSSDGNYLASVSADRTVRVWDWRKGRELWSDIAHSNSAVSVAFSPDGETLATTGEDGMLRLWRWKLGTLVLEYPLVVADVWKLSFCPDGMKITVLEPDGLRIYDAQPARDADDISLLPSPPPSPAADGPSVR